jgi:hypothetical protein
MGMASMRKWIRRYGSREHALHARLRERRLREFLRRDYCDRMDTPFSADHTSDPRSNICSRVPSERQSSSVTG